MQWETSRWLEISNQLIKIYPVKILFGPQPDDGWSTVSELSQISDKVRLDLWRVKSELNSLWPSDTIWWLIWVNIGSANGLLPDITKPLHEPRMTYHKKGSMASISGHWSWDKIAANSQEAFSNAFHWMKIMKFWLKFHWSLFLQIQLTVLGQIMAWHQTGIKPIYWWFSARKT